MRQKIKKKYKCMHLGRKNLCLKLRNTFVFLNFKVCKEKKHVDKDLGFF